MNGIYTALAYYESIMSYVCILCEQDQLIFNEFGNL